MWQQWRMRVGDAKQHLCDVHCCLFSCNNWHDPASSAKCCKLFHTFCFSKWKCHSREIQLHCTAEMLKYVSYTHIHACLHILTHANTDVAIHSCFYTYRHARTLSHTHTQASIVEEATKVRRAVEVLFYSCFNLGTRWGGCSTPRHGRLTPGNTRYSFYRRLVGPQGRYKWVRKISPLSIHVHKHTHQ